ncbi:MAG: GntR family transcriptional regulator [Kiritimatiellae bacterium]|nr:GntR family transcriptional regulator [Kiritimatiellia bacterium]
MKIKAKQTANNNMWNEIELPARVVTFMLKRGAFKDKPMHEADMARTAGVSRTTMREALARLDSAGLIERRRKKGVYLRVPSTWEAAEVYDIRSVLEGLAGRLVALSADKQGIKRLRRYERGYVLGLKRAHFHKYANADRQFHETLIELSGYATLRRQLFPLYVQKRIFNRERWEPPLPRMDDNPVTHGHIIDALLSGDPDKAEALIRGHIQYAKQQLMKHVLGIVSLNCLKCPGPAFNS